MYDQWLPVPYGGLDGSSSRLREGPRFWRDTPRSEPREITPPAFEPLSRAEAKLHLRTGLTDEDAWFDRTIPAARRQVETDTNRTFVQTVWEMTFDQFPIERYIELPRPPLVSVASLSSFDLLTGLETVVDPSTYYLDTYSQPGRVILVPGKIWPTGVRWQQGGKVRWTAGYSGVAQAIASITRVGAVATVTTVAPHGYASNQQLTVFGADQADYNGTFQVTVTGAATFTYAVANNPATPATGVLTVASLGVPSRYVHAIALLLGHWNFHREAVTSGAARYSPDLYPLGYDALISDRIVGLG